MKYETKFDIGQEVCFKDMGDGGVMRGMIHGVVVDQRQNWEHAPTDYVLSSAPAPQKVITYQIVVKTSSHRGPGIMRHVPETKVALTFDEAWKLA